MNLHRIIDITYRINFMNLRKALYDCYYFVMQRKKQEGGFSATSLLPATVEDTYHALKIIKDMDKFGLAFDYKPDRDESLKSWLYQNMKWKEPKVFYQFLRICIFCNIEIKKEFLEQSMDFLVYGKITLERAFYLAKISELMNFQMPYIKKLPAPKIAKDLYMYIYLVDNGIIKKKSEKQRLIEFFRKCQNPDGGFGFFPATTSYMDNTYFCLKGLNYLGSKPKNPEDALNFILFCQTKSGGFARTPRAAAFLDSTFYAVESLKILYKDCL